MLKSGLTMPERLHGHCMAVVSPHEILIAGGFSTTTNDYSDKTFVYNTLTKSWKTRGWMAMKHGPKTNAACSAITWGNEHRVLMVGGWNNHGLDSTELFDANKEHWKVISANLSSPALDHNLKSAVVVELNKKPLALGGVKCTGYVSYKMYFVVDDYNCFCFRHHKAMQDCKRVDTVLELQSSSVDNGGLEATWVEQPELKLGSPRSGHSILVLPYTHLRGCSLIP